jgi:hypothetical protein
MADHMSFVLNNCKEAVIHVGEIKQSMVEITQSD